MSDLPPLTPEEARRYSRHLLLPEIGRRGQQKLKGAAVLIVGVGGLGSPVALYLAAAGVGRIGLVDGDQVEVSNLQRQVLYETAQQGMPKVWAARQRLLSLNPEIQVEAYAQPFAAEQALEIARPYDVLVDCSDNFPTRYLVNDVAVAQDKPDVYGAIYRFEGQVSVFHASQGPCYRCVFPTPPPPPAVPSCADRGVLGVLPGVVGALQATEVLKLLLGIGKPLLGQLLLYDALALTFEKVHLRKRPECPVCGAQPEITSPTEDPLAQPAAEEHCPQEMSTLTPQDLARRLQAPGEKPLLLDVRRPEELEIARFPGAVFIPLEALPQRLGELDPQREIVVFCRQGNRAARAWQILREAGFPKVRVLRGGLNAWSREVDPEWPAY